MFLISFHLRSINLIRVCLAFLGLLWLGALVTRATPYYVATNGDETSNGMSWAAAVLTISNGVAKATTAGDTVWVSNGTYTLTAQISLIDKSITLQSFKGRDLTFINGNYPNTLNRCIYIVNANAVVSGFTISNGSAVHGGGVHINNNGGILSGILTNCVIAGNRATNSDTQGGGIFSLGTNLIVDCVVTGNTSAQYGGGVMIYSSIMKNCTIIGNSSTNEGGGVYGQFGSVFSNCEIIGNTAGGMGSGMYLASYSVGDSCVIASNQGSIAVNLPNTGGGRPAVLKNSVIKYNNGIGVEVNSGSIVQNCLITRNSGEAIKLLSLQTYTGYVANCTIVSNQSFSMTLGGPTTDTVFNCIIASNKNGIYMDGGSTTNAFWYSCTPGDSSFPPSRGNITSDPRFIDAIPGSANNWRLMPTSPCVNTGTNMSWMTNSVDLDGRTRIRYRTVDMGAYELINQATLYGFR